MDNNLHIINLFLSKIKLPPLVRGGREDYFFFFFAAFFLAAILSNLRYFFVKNNADIIL